LKKNSGKIKKMIVNSRRASPAQPAPFEPSRAGTQQRY